MWYKIKSGSSLISDKDSFGEFPDKLFRMIYLSCITTSSFSFINVNNDPSKLHSQTISGFSSFEFIKSDKS
jgi:hypothetical protein